jgi:hypothetical protein
MIGRKLFAALGVVLLGAGLMGVPVLAKCPRKCKSQFAHALTMCKKGCPKHKAGKTCRMACAAAKTDSVKKCRAATNPSPPGCSPSSAFLDDRSSF